MERYAMNGTAARYGGRSTGSAPIDCCVERFCTAQNASADGPVSPRTNAAECLCDMRREERADVSRKCGCDLTHVDKMPLTMGYVPMQKWCDTYGG